MHNKQTTVKYNDNEEEDDENDDGVDEEDTVEDELASSHRTPVGIVSVLSL